MSERSVVSDATPLRYVKQKCSQSDEIEFLRRSATDKLGNDIDFIMLRTNTRYWKERMAI